MNSITSIVIADDHPVIRQGLKALLENEPGFQVVAEAGNGQEAIDTVEEFDPQVLVLDISMPVMNGIEVAEKLRKQGKQTRIVILSMHATDTYFIEALRNNVDSYILKEETAEILIQAVREVANGRRFISPSLTGRTIDAYLKVNHDDPKAHEEYHKLTARERDVLKLIAEGHTNSNIASRLEISHRTVEAHRSNIMHKLGFVSQADLVLFAVHCGILH